MKIIESENGEINETAKMAKRKKIMKGSINNEISSMA
jgi:hypothetical protein